MTPTRRLRTKACQRCGQEADVLYRVRHDASAAWVFVCAPCQGEVSSNNPHYQYGGTWKSRKRH